MDNSTTARFFTLEQFQRDIDYIRAQKITKSMYDAGLITSGQFVRLTELNRKSFSPFLVELFPRTVDITAHQR